MAQSAIALRCISIRAFLPSADSAAPLGACQAHINSTCSLFECRTAKSGVATPSQVRRLAAPYRFSCSLAYPPPVSSRTDVAVACFRRHIRHIRNYFWACAGAILVRGAFGVAPSRRPSPCFTSYTAPG